MDKTSPRIAVFPGAFDPATNGHLDVIRRGSRLFEELIVAVGDNPAKKAMFSHAERCAMLRELTAAMANVRVAEYTGLTVEFVRGAGAAAILRGIRNATDLQFELELALTNRAVTGVETVFITPAAEYAFTSSTLIRQIASMGGDVSALVPPLVARRLAEKAASRGS
ncbi:MAG: pantetheine-phosphate adenylyltransferase [Planctomycetes bacterium]|nr:pantetheine-phosphate adenylyltransferase [Planctomycetota bacterium]